ncbi:hypothetical protein [uncultured Nocardioides sp.]|uniref:hypothetical protein n=1 Tax=uncultured Nocardioides sp. TaxID=198441 RepID=UPI0025FF3806|nr:hypothetical protein [uncultured Nocardioides sp.]
MSDSGKTLPRPRQVTWAAWMIMLGSAFVVVTGYEAVAGLRTLDSRTAVEDFLAEPPGSGLGLSVEDVLTVMHVSALVAAVCATAAAVLGFYVLQRHRGARVVLAVLAVPLFLTGIVAGGFMSSLVAVAALVLWLQPARDWFDGKAAPPQPERDDARRSAVWPPPVAEQPPVPPTGGPRPFQAFGQGATTMAVPAGAPAPVRAPARRPGTVVVAAIVTWVVAGFALVSSLAAIAVVASSPDLVLDEVARQNPELADQGVTESALVAATYVMGGLVALWAGLACVCAAVMLHRNTPAARALTVSSVATAVFCLVGSLASGALAVPALAAVVVVALMRRPEVRAWFASR